MNQAIALYSTKFIFTAKQISEMAETQDKTNQKMFGENWVDMKPYELPYFRATLVEAVEAIAERGYKWWKKDSCNFDHLKMELIDMLHFVLSDEIRRYKNIPTLVANYERDSKRPIELKAIGRFADVLAFNQYGFKVDSTNPKISRVDDLKIAFHFNDLCEQLIFTSLVDGVSNIHILALLFEILDMDASEVALQYIAKNVLNHFRDDNGQKTGAYYRMWDGIEDNEVLMDFTRDNPEADRSEIYSFLCKRYTHSELRHMTHKI